MSAHVHTMVRSGKARATTGDPAWVRWCLIGFTLLSLGLLLVLPLAIVFIEAFRQGSAHTWPASAMRRPGTRSS